MQRYWEKMEHRFAEAVMWPPVWDAVIKPDNAGRLPWEEAEFYETTTLMSVNDILVESEAVDFGNGDIAPVFYVTINVMDGTRRLSGSVWIKSESAQRQLHALLCNNTGKPLKEIEALLIASRKSLQG